MIDVRFITFISLCETRNYTKTAELLYVTQPTVTHHIKSIEKSYDIKLFTSNNKNFQLTPEGELLYKYVLQLQSFDAQFERILRANEKEKENVSFAATTATNNGFLKYILANWTHEHKNLVYQLNMTNYSSIIDGLRIGLYDFAVIDNNFSKRNFNAIPLLQTRLVLGVSKKHPLAKKKSVSFDELIDTRLILDASGNNKRDFLESELKQKNRNVKELRNVLEINCPKTATEMVIKGDCASIFYLSEIENEVRSGKIVPLDINESKNSVEFNLIFNKNHLRSKLIEEIADEFVKIYKEMNYLQYTSSL